MNRLLIHSNGTGDGYTSATAATLTHVTAAALPALNGSSGGESSGSGCNPPGNNNDVRRLQDEVNQLTKRNGGTKLSSCTVHRVFLCFILSYLVATAALIFLFFVFPTNSLAFVFLRADAAVGQSGTKRQGDVGPNEKGFRTKRRREKSKD